MSLETKWQQQGKKPELTAMGKTHTPLPFTLALALHVHCNIELTKTYHWLNVHDPLHPILPNLISDFPK